MNDMKNNTNLVDANDEKEQGASLVEYALLVALIAVVCIVAVKAVGNAASQKFSSVASVLE